MPSFTVTAANPTVALSTTQRSGSFDLRVSNQSGFTLTARLQIESQANPAGLKARLVTANGAALDNQSPEIELKANESVAFRLLVEADPRLAPGTYGFLAKAVNTANTDADIGLGPTLTVTMPQQIKPPLPGWLAFAIIGVLLVIGVTVTVILALRPKELPTLAMPALTGLSFDDAVHALQTSTLRLGTTEQRNDEKAADGSVLQQEPAAETAVQVGTVVNLVLAQRPPPARPPVTVKIAAPDVTGRSLEEASTELAKAGLRFTSAIGGSNAAQADSLVLSQNPAPGTPLDKGGLVSLSINRIKQVELGTVQREALLLKFNQGLDKGTIRKTDKPFTVRPQ